MTPVVIDASIAVSWVLPDEHSEVADRALEALVGRRGYVPPIFEYEVASAVTSASRRGRLSEADVELTLRQLADLQVTCSHEGQAAEHLINAGGRHDLSVYDAAYLVLAERHGAALATADARLRAVAERAGVPLI